MGKTTIEWTDFTFNPWRGCTKVSQGCKNCYAEQMSGRNPAVLGIWGRQGSRPVATESYWQQPIKWNRDAAAAGERRRVFCASLADVFEGRDTMPESAWADVCDARERLLGIIDDTPWLDWLLLTKRPENVMGMIGDWAYAHVGIPRNVWIGTSVEDQAAADARIPHLLKVPARVRFLSCEPLLGAVDLTRYLGGGYVTIPRGGGTPMPANVPNKDLHWVIAGGESGPAARPMHPAWARGLRDQCEAAGTAFFFKQWGEWREASQSERNATTPTPNGINDVMVRVGKARAGRLLDGVEYNGMPEVQR